MRLAVAAMLALGGCVSAHGSPAAAPLLANSKWTIEDVAGGGVTGNARLSIEFGGDGRVSGHSGCNRFTGGYTQTGAAISFTPMAGTRMACPDPLMGLEDRVLAVLQAARTVAADGSGAVRLTGPDGRALKLRRVP